MATISVVAPHTRIDNSIIVNMAEIGVYCYAVYSAIKMHLNQATGACFPSYATIARITGIHRSTVIECVKKLRALNLVDPRHRFKEDGSYTSNQYDFQCPDKPGYSTKIEKSIEIHAPAKPGATHKQGAGTSVPSKGVDPSTPMQGTDKSAPVGSRPERPPVVAQDNPSSRPERPEQVSSSNKKQRTIAEVDFVASEKQHTCSHPASEIVLLPDQITICNHCYGLLDEHLHLLEEDKSPAEGVSAA